MQAAVDAGKLASPSPPASSRGGKPPRRGASEPVRRGSPQHSHQDDSRNHKLSTVQTSPPPAPSRTPGATLSQMKPETEKPGVLAPVAKCQVYFQLCLLFTVEMYKANGRGEPTLLPPRFPFSLSPNKYLLCND